MFVMISYDVVDDKKRLKLTKFLKDHGDRVQKSVFECNLSPKTYERVKSGIEKVINKRKDRVRYYRLCKGCVDKVEISGWGEVTEEEEFIVV
ncbi:MAG: CRISPR-associated endonuclease Cas2 [Deltaproteobacteria bacterium CG_4_8_14_3_um_filter_45_9]|jgi:CRISPR-associated protein Cas2|nr:MAG: CRISPR-associated endonuclease Cas2 [Deltaproteobacteria bacterium CG_4_8_14_3_um_filter_45_9]